MDNKTIDASIQTDKLNKILEKKQTLEANIEDFEKRIDEKISSLVAEGLIPEPKPIETVITDLTETDLAVQPVISDLKQEDIFSSIDLSDDAALDQAVLNSVPVSSIPVPSKQSPAQTDTSETTLLTDSIEDVEILTTSSVLGPKTTFDQDKTEIKLPSESFPTKEFLKTPSEMILKSPEKATGNSSRSENQPLADIILEESDKKSKSKKSAARTHKTNSQPVIKPTLQNILFPAVLFILGIVACGVYLIGFSQNFSFIDYSILFILLTCLIFTIALPYTASIFFMAMLTVGYGLFIILSTIYIEIPLAAYQFGWFLLIPLILIGSALLVRRVREVFLFKASLEDQISSYHNMENTPGLTTEKAYYKDLEISMKRASNNEIVLLLEMITIPHLKTLKSINGSRIWDEILFKTLKIIKKHCYSTHLIYILEGNVFSIIMENTSTKNQLLINQSIRNDFHDLIESYDCIDEAVDLKFVAIPYSREINTPFDYRSIGFKQL